eukprot:SAG25_NODE_11518_length_302_cov_0.985222_1_plen_48_part_10
MASNFIDDRVAVVAGQIVEQHRDEVVLRASLALLQIALAVAGAAIVAG